MEDRSWHASLAHSFGSGRRECRHGPALRVLEILDWNRKTYEESMLLCLRLQAVRDTIEIIATWPHIPV